MSWYFFGGFSAYAIVPSGAVVEPLRVLLHPGVVGGALQREVEGDLQPQLARRAPRSRSKSSSVPRSGWMASWPPSGEPIAHGTPTSSGPAVEGVVAGPCGTSCRSGGSAAGRPRRSPSRRSRAAARRRCGTCRDGRLRRRALGAREELVPGPEQRPLPLDQQRQRLGGGDQLAQRMPRQGRVHLRRQRRRQPGYGRTARRRAGRRPRQHRGAVRSLGHSVGRPLVQARALLEDQLRVHARRGS